MKRPSGSSHRSHSSRPTPRRKHHGLRGLAGSKQGHIRQTQYAANVARGFAERAQCEYAFVWLGKALAHEEGARKEIPSVEDARREVFDICKASARRR